MTVAIGKKGNVTVRTSAASNETIAEMGSWSISGPTRNMVEVSAFGDKTGRQELGTLTAQTFTFDGFYDGTDTGMTAIIQALSSAGPIACSTVGSTYPARFQLWAQNDTDLNGYGWWGLSTANTTTAKVYITGMELGQGKDGIGTVSFTGAVVGDDLAWTTSTA